MRLRDLIFVAVVVLGTVLLVERLFVTSPRAMTRTNPARAVDDVAARLNAVLASEWESRGLQPAPKAEDLLLARRLSLALVGSIPSLEEIRAFEARPPEERFDWYLEYLLQDRRHHQSFAERFTRAFVGTHIEPPNVFRRDIFADWIAEQIRVDRPYDEWVREMIASTGFWTEVPALNYLTATCDFNTYEGPDKVQLAGRTAQAFLGVNLECAECHDHPFDIWTRADFHGIAAFFADTRRTSYGGLRDFPGESQAESTDTPNFPQRVFAQPELLPESGTDRERLAIWVTAAENRAFARTIVNRIWALLLGAPLVGTVSSLPTDGPFPEALELLADDFIANNFRIRRLVRIIAKSTPFQVKSYAIPSPDDHRNDEPNWSSYPITRLRPDQQCNAILQSGRLTTYDNRINPVTRSLDNVRHLRFREQFGDLGEKEYADTSASVTQKLLLMNGELIKANTEASMVTGSARVALLEETPEKMVEIAYLSTLTRRPTPRELEHFAQRLMNTKLEERLECLEDLYWSLVNSTEFSWHH